jgi:hypothetical protein
MFHLPNVSKVKNIHPYPPAKTKQPSAYFNNYNQTNPKKQPKSKNQTQKQPHKKVVHTKHPQLQPNKKQSTKENVCLYFI